MSFLDNIATGISSATSALKSINFGGLWGYSVYSFLDLSGAISHPLVDSFVLTGQGVGKIIINMTNDKTFHEVDTRGVVLVGRIPTNNGQIQVQCQQTSDVHKWFLYLYNQIETSNDATQWAKISCTLRSICDGTEYTFQGVSFDKVPEKIYASIGDMCFWSFSVANIVAVRNTTTNAGSALIDKFKGLLGG